MCALENASIVRTLFDLLLCSLWWLWRDEQQISYKQNSCGLCLYNFYCCQLCSDILCGSDMEFLMSFAVSCLKNWFSFKKYDKNSKKLLQQQKCQNMDKFYYNLVSIQDQAQLPSSNRLEMAIIEKLILKINHLKISNLLGFFIFGFLPKEYIWSLAAVINLEQTKTTTILLKRNQLSKRLIRATLSLAMAPQK